jgi:hypothetical protein
MQQVTNNWNNFYQTQSRALWNSLPTNGTYVNNFGLMYWQWANSYLTETYFNGIPSLANYWPLNYAGYYEISYFKTAYFNTVASQANIDSFASLQMYSNINIPGSNYENIFLTYDIYTKNPKSNPPVNSLFNMNTMQQLVSLGMSTPNILKADKGMIYGVDFGLNDDWFALTYTLGLDFPQQTYFLWLWLDTAMDMSWNRIQDGGNSQTGPISTLGASAFASAMTIM